MGCASGGDREQQQRAAPNLSETVPEETSELISGGKCRVFYISLDDYIHIHFFTASTFSKLHRNGGKKVRTETEAR